MLYRKHGQLTSSLVFFEDGVDCLSSLGGAMSGSVLTPFFCSGEFFASGPLPSNPTADVCRCARSHVVEDAVAAAGVWLWQLCSLNAPGLQIDASPLQH